MKLNDEQKKIIEDSMWVVNTALKKNGLEHDNDMRQTAVLYMCKCLLRFDSSKHAKWTTYAYKNVYFYIKREHKRQSKEYLHTASEDAFCYGLEVVDKYPLDIEYQMFYEKLLNSCNEQECEIINLRLQGFNIGEISEKFNVCRTSIINKLKTIKEKANDLREYNNY